MRLRWLGLIIGIFTVVWLLAPLLCEEPIPNIEPQQSRLTQKMNNESNDSATESADPSALRGQLANPANRQTKSEPKRQSHSGPIEYFSNLICLIAGIPGQTYFIFLTAIFTWLLARYTYQLVGATESSARAASDSARAADRQGDILVGIERPWVISLQPKIAVGNEKERWRLPEKIDHPADIRITYTLRNTGNSPAFLTYYWRSGPMVKEIPSDPPQYNKRSRFQPFIIPPKEEHEDVVLERKVSVEKLQQIKDGKLAIVFYGKIDYESRIGTPKKHTSKFCHIWGYKDGRSFIDPSGPPGWTEYT